MERGDLLKNIVRLCQWKIHEDTVEQIQTLHNDIWQRMDGLSVHEMWEVMITRNGCALIAYQNNRRIEISY